MKKETKKSYEPPVSTCTQVVLESPICADSEYKVQSPHGNNVEAHEVNQEFSDLNDFTKQENGPTWD